MDNEHVNTHDKTAIQYFSDLLKSGKKYIAIVANEDENGEIENILFTAKGSKVDILALMAHGCRHATREAEIPTAILAEALIYTKIKEFEHEQGILKDEEDEEDKATVA